MSDIAATIYFIRKHYKTWRATIDLNGVRVEYGTPMWADSYSVPYDMGREVEIQLAVQNGDLIDYHVAILNDRNDSQPIYTSFHCQYHVQEELEEIEIFPRCGGRLKGRLKQIADLSRVDPPLPTVWRSWERKHKEKAL